MDLVYKHERTLFARVLSLLAGAARVVVAMIGIRAAVALPACQGYVQKAAVAGPTIFASEAGGPRARARGQRTSGHLPGQMPLARAFEAGLGIAAQDGPEAIALRHAIFEQSAKLPPLLAQEGVNITAGTDAGFLNSFNYPGRALHDEIGLYVRYALTPQQALQGAVAAGRDAAQGGIASDAGKAGSRVESRLTRNGQTARSRRTRSPHSC